MTADIHQLIAKIIYNLLLNENYAMTYLARPYCMKNILEIVLKMQVPYSIVCDIIMLITYIFKQGMEYDFSEFTKKSIQYFVDKQNTRKDNLPTLKKNVETFRRILLNFIKSRNGIALSSMIDTDLSRCLIDLAETYHDVCYIIEELIYIMTLFCIEDKAINFFYENNLLHKVLIWIKDRENFDRTSLICSFQLMQIIILFKSYSISTSVKLQFLASIFIAYEREEDLIYKRDLLRILKKLYENQDFEAL